MFLFLFRNKRKTRNTYNPPGLKTISFCNNPVRITEHIWTVSMCLYLVFDPSPLNTPTRAPVILSSVDQRRHLVVNTILREGKRNSEVILEQFSTSDKSRHNFPEYPDQVRTLSSLVVKKNRSCLTTIVSFVGLLLHTRVFSKTLPVISCITYANHTFLYLLNRIL